MTSVYAGRWAEAVLDSNSQLIKNGVFSVYTDAAATTLATLYSDANRTTSSTSSVQSDSTGNLQFYAVPGTYYVKNVASGNVQQITVYEDPRDTADEGELTAEAQARAQSATSTLAAAKAYTDASLVTATPLVEKQNVISASGAAVTIPDLTVATANRVVLTANCTFTFPTPSTANLSKSFALALVQDSTGSRTATWPGNVKWPGGVAPTLSTGANKVDMLGFTCSDGVNYYGFVLGLDIR